MAHTNLQQVLTSRGAPAKITGEVVDCLLMLSYSSFLMFLVDSCYSIVLLIVLHCCYMFIFFTYLSISI